VRWLRNLRLSAHALGRAWVRTLLSASGMTVGIAATFMLFAMTAGAEKAISDALEAMGRNLLAVGPTFRDSDALRGEAQRYRTLTLGDWEAIRSEAGGVERAAPVAMGDFDLRHGGNATGATVIGTTPEYRYTNVHHPRAGRFLDDLDVRGLARVAVIGSQIVKDLFHGEQPIGERLLIGGAPYEVIGVLREKGADAGGVPQDDKVLVPVTTAMRRLLNVDTIDRIFVQAGSRELVATATDSVRALLRDRHALDIADRPDDFTIRDQAELVRALRRSDETLQRFMAGMSALLLALASIGLLAVSLVSVRQRRAEIGLRLAVGALPRQVMVQFLLEAAMLAMLGALSGLFVGGAGIILGGWLMDWQMRVTGLNTLYSMLIPLGLALLAGAYPAFRAARLDPAHALRG
jgi:putative ABC transport system permease protein